MLLRNEPRSRAALPGGPSVRAGRSSVHSLGAVAPILAQATLQELGTPPEGPPVARRSVALTVGLDLLFPAAGAAYALRGSPYLTSNWLSQWGWWVGGHALLDVLAAINLGFGVDYYRHGQTTLGVGYICGAIGGLLLNRFIAVLFQVPVVQLGNSAADNGLWLDPSRAPARLSDAL